MKEYLDIPFKAVEGHDLTIDIRVPEDVTNPPLIMWIHGGGWKDLNKHWILVRPMLECGYALASVEYRYSDEAIFPAQMLDLKEALLYLKKHGEEYGYDASRIAVSGDSAGGHLAILMAVSAGNKLWEKEDEDYSLQACVDFCGPSLFPEQPGNTVIEQLVGVPTVGTNYQAHAAQIRPINYINGTEPPFLILHGSCDPVVDPANPRALRNALEAAGDAVHMYFVPGGEHGLSGALVDGIIKEFLDYYLKQERTVITPELQPCHDRTVPKTERYLG